MTGTDHLKALAGGFGLLALNLLATTAVITADALLVEPGHPEAYYQAKAPGIGAWSGPIGGAILLLAAAWMLGRRRPGRNPLAFALWLFVAYLVFDAASGVALAGPKAVADPLFLGSMALALAGAITGGWLARRAAS
jgi:hypothetical protein